jgi:hypothetical protein
MIAATDTGSGFLHSRLVYFLHKEQGPMVVASGHLVKVSARVGWWGVHPNKGGMAKPRLAGAPPWLSPSATDDVP